MHTLLVTALLLAAQSSGQPADDLAPKLDLRVLYAGSAEGPRTADFVEFLQEHFAVVGTAVYADLTPADADAYDVVVLDVQMNPTETSIGIGKQPTLPQSWARATVLVNGPGIVVAERQLKAKLDWL